MLKSDRLHLRAVEPSDADFMYDVENDSDAWKYSDTVAPISRSLLRDYALNYDADPFRAGQIRLIVSRNDDNLPVGIADLYDINPGHRRAFIGIYIRSCARGSGYGTEAVGLIEKYASDILHLLRLGAKTAADNTNAVRLFEGKGYEKQGVLKDWLLKSDGSHDDLILMSRSLLPNE